MSADDLTQVPPDLDTVVRFNVDGTLAEVTN